MLDAVKVNGHISGILTGNLQPIAEILWYRAAREAKDEVIILGPKGIIQRTVTVWACNRGCFRKTGNQERSVQRTIRLFWRKYDTGFKPTL